MDAFELVVIGVIVGIMVSAVVVYVTRLTPDKDVLPQRVRYIGACDEPAPQVETVRPYICPQREWDKGTASGHSNCVVCSRCLAHCLSSWEKCPNASCGVKFRGEPRPLPEGEETDDA